eukprot:TRINITY_DN256_c0_g1_i1.p1 TRINITY_DN256_c0_g1~~TRINITY_DN256_c0_g1_i1.p1  ORF type:complete len:372 (+),score=73.96 TRINITY_DN256_c0_g1_i1:18-1133(+)
MLLLLAIFVSCSHAFLQIDRNSKQFQWDGKEVFLNGVNQAWVNYGNDFGNAQSTQDYCALRDTLKNISLSGGHAIRIWLFVEGFNIPLFDSNGFVIGTDSKGTLVEDMRRYLWTAQEYGITVFWCLWNGAVLRNNNVIQLIKNQTLLQSFIENALVPVVKQLSNEIAVGGWEIINEPEGSVAIEDDESHPCFSTINLKGTGAGWTGDNLRMKDIQRFINLQAGAIHRADPKSLVTVGSWSEHASTDQFGYRNYYKDECLLLSGGDVNGTLDFYQIHSYASSGSFNTYAPFKVTADDYKLDKPLVIGEFNDQDSGGMSAPSMYQYVYNNNYNGAWGWTADPKDNNFEGMDSISRLPRVSFQIPPPPKFPNPC